MREEGRRCDSGQVCLTADSSTLGAYRTNNMAQGTANAAVDFSEALHSITNIIGHVKVAVEQFNSSPQPGRSAGSISDFGVGIQIRRRRPMPQVTPSYVSAPRAELQSVSLRKGGASA